MPVAAWDGTFHAVSERRKFLQQATAASLLSPVPTAVRTGAWAAGSEAPENKEVKVGFIRSPTAPRS